MTPSRTTTAPKISQGPGTPPDEWARETEGAINQHSSRNVTTNDDRSNVASPRYEPPGAFPMASTPEASPTSIVLGENAKQGVGGAYMTAHHDVEGVYATAENAARRYLPTSVVGKLEGVGVLRENPEYQEKPSLQTQESESSFTPTHGGVGSLPGAKDKAGVVILPKGRKVEETEKAKDTTLSTETGSHQSTSKPSPPSSTTSASPTTTMETPDSVPFPTNPSDSPQDLHTTANVSSNTNPFISQQPAPGNAEKQALESANSAAKASTPSGPVSLSGTLTSPDRDAQAAARAGQAKEAPGGPRVGDQSSTAAQAEMTGGSETADKAEGTTVRTTLSHTNGAQTVKNDDASRIGGGGSRGGKEECSVVSNGKRGHTRKSSFVQKLKGEAKAFAERVKTRTRG